jgi:hypothetical protein
MGGQEFVYPIDSQSLECMNKHRLSYGWVNKPYNNLGLAILSSESLASTVHVCWSRAKARDRKGSVARVPIPDRGRQARAVN